MGKLQELQQMLGDSFEVGTTGKPDFYITINGSNEIPVKARGDCPPWIAVPRGVEIRPANNGAQGATWA